MRRTLPFLAAIVVLGACHRKVDLIDTGPAHVEPASTSIWGDWVMATPPDSTAFTGASSVEMALQPGSFVITATYPNRAPLVVRGVASLAETSLLTLTPTAEMDGLAKSGAMVMTPGQPTTMMATAAGGSLIFAAPNADAAIPTSVWHKRADAKAAGTLKTTP